MPNTNTPSDFSGQIKGEETLSSVEIDRIIEMAWEDRTPFEAIEAQFGTPEATVIRIMRRYLKPSSFRLWRKRVNEGVSLKHRKKRSSDIDRFKSDQHRAITNNAISKRGAAWPAYKRNKR